MKRRRILVILVLLIVSACDAGFIDRPQLAVQTSDTRWCSDGFEFRCEDGAKLSVTFALDCCDREAIG